MKVRDVYRLKLDTVQVRRSRPRSAAQPIPGTRRATPFTPEQLARNHLGRTEADRYTRAEITGLLDD